MLRTRWPTKRAAARLARTMVLKRKERIEATRPSPVDIRNEQRSATWVEEKAPQRLGRTAAIRETLAAAPKSVPATGTAAESIRAAVVPRAAPLHRQQPAPRARAPGGTRRQRKRATTRGTRGQRKRAAPRAAPCRRPRGGGRLGGAAAARRRRARRGGGGGAEGGREGRARQVRAVRAAVPRAGAAHVPRAPLRARRLRLRGVRGGGPAQARHVAPAVRAARVRVPALRGALRAAPPPQRPHALPPRHPAVNPRDVAT
ncbi:hypothetical protein FGB62_137g12 [Gracilaria domingensis]|nr:hypothetical protein FGB62_137g12 [Gracilaria domingensis]